MEDQSFSSSNPMYYSATVGDCLSYAWHVMWNNIGSFLAVFAVMVLIMMPNYFFSFVSELFPLVGEHIGMDMEVAAAIVALVFGLASMAYSMLVGQPVSFGFQYTTLLAARGERFEVRDLFEGFRNYLSVILASLLLGIIIFFGIIMLIIPGIILGCRLAFVPLLVVDKKMQALDAISESWRMTKGYGWTIFGLGFVSIFIFIAGFLCLLVGVIFSSIWVQTAFSALYHAISVSEEPEF